MMQIQFDLDAEQVDKIVATTLIWMHQEAELTDKERKAYELVIHDFLDQRQWQQFIGEEIDE